MTYIWWKFDTETTQNHPFFQMQLPIFEQNYWKHLKILDHISQYSHHLSNIQQFFWMLGSRLSDLEQRPIF